MGFSGSTARFDRDRQALPFAFVTAERVEDSFFRRLTALCGARVVFCVQQWPFERYGKITHSAPEKALNAQNQQFPCQQL